MPLARSARTMTSRMTGPRRLPTWTVPDGVFESLTTCGPLTDAASSSAQSMAPIVPGAALLPAAAVPRLPDRDDLVGEVPRGHPDEDLLALLLAEQGPSDRALV